MKKLFLLYIFSSVVFAAFGQSDTAATVRLKTFEALKTGENVQLKWAVACNLDFAKFNVQRSGDGVTFTTIDSFSADRLRCLQPFSYVDRTAFGNIYYRIKVQDKDGHNSIEKTISATGKQIDEIEMRILNSFSAKTVSVEILSNTEEKGTLILTSITGIALKTVAVKLVKGLNNLSISADKTASGIYTVTFATEEGRKAVRVLR